MIDRAMDRIIERVIAWGEARPDIRAAFIVGSRARADHPADEWSDLDVVIVADDPQPYLASAEWLSAIGDARLTFLEPTAVGGLTERRALFDGGLDVDFTFIPTGYIQHMLQHALPVEVARVFQHGVRILFDKDAAIAGLVHAPPSEQPRLKLPTSAEYGELVNDFLYHAIWVAKKLRRGEVFVAKTSCDIHMKWLLLRLIEWHAQAINGPVYQTWHAGRFLEQWADPRIIADLGSTYAQYDAADVRRALYASLRVFHWIALEAADHLQYEYPHDAHAYVETWLNAQLPEETQQHNIRA